MIVVAVVVLHSCPGVITGGIDGDLVFVLTKITEAALLCYGLEDMEELADIPPMPRL